MENGDGTLNSEIERDATFEEGKVEYFCVNHDQGFLCLEQTLMNCTFIKKKW